jgi:hypothetical protein
MVAIVREMAIKSRRFRRMRLFILFGSKCRSLGGKRFSELSLTANSA